MIILADGVRIVVKVIRDGCRLHTGTVQRHLFSADVVLPGDSVFIAVEGVLDRLLDTGAVEGHLCNVDIVLPGDGVFIAVEGVLLGSLSTRAIKRHLVDVGSVILADGVRIVVEGVSHAIRNAKVNHHHGALELGRHTPVKLVVLLQIIVLRHAERITIIGVLFVVTKLTESLSALELGLTFVPVKFLVLMHVIILGDGVGIAIISVPLAFVNFAGSHGALPLGKTLVPVELIVLMKVIILGDGIGIAVVRISTLVVVLAARADLSEYRLTKIVKGVCTQERN